MAEDKLAEQSNSGWEVRFDNKKWRHFSIKGGYVVVTDSGRKFIHNHPNILSDLSEYKRGIPEKRKWLNRGQRAEIYEIPGSGVVVKESNYVHSVPDAIDRMDHLYDIAAHFPNWIKVPEHLGLVYSENLDRQFLIMEKVGEGESVKDILASDVDGKTKSLIERKFDKAKKIIDGVIKKEVSAKRLSPTMNLLFDWHEGNVVVDFKHPTRELPFTMWVLDQ
jgi:hypothetical protein